MSALSGADPGIENGGLLMRAKRAKIFEAHTLFTNHTPFQICHCVLAVNNSVDIL